MASGLEQIREKIKSFQRKHYLNIFIRGSILTLSFIVVYFLLAALAENSLWLGHWARLFIFFTFFALVAFCVFHYLKEPIRWWIANKGIGEEKSAEIIGNKIPRIKDRLLNLIQLSASSSSDLGLASIQQKTSELEPFTFDSIVDITYNKKYLTYLLIPLGIIILILFINHNIITKSADRIIHFNQQYSPQAPFKFSLGNKSLNAFYNESFTLELKLNGNAIPENVYIYTGSLRLKMDRSQSGEFFYVFDNLQQDLEFQFEAAGFYSDKFELNVYNRPELTKFTIQLEYPKYLQQKNQSLNNAGNLEVPEGTIVQWFLNTAFAEKSFIQFESDKTENELQLIDKQKFGYKKAFRNSDQYEFVLQNEKSQNKEKIAYRIDIIKDEFPQIKINNFKDSVLYKRIILSGNISDDHGITDLALHFRIKDKNQKEVSSSIVNIDLIKNQTQQNFFYNWSLDSIKIASGETLDYFLQVRDNDGVNGRKSTKSATYSFLIPTEDNLLTNIDQSRNKTQQKIDESVNKANKLQDQIEQANQKLKGKQNLDWQDKKMLEDIIHQKENLDRMINQVKEQNKELQEKKDAFTEQDQRIKEKAEQVQKLMDEFLDEETKKLFEELEKLLKENSEASQIQKLLDKINQNTSNLEKELDRMLELFKQVEYETKLDLTIEKLKQQIEQQKSLLEKTDQNSSEKNDSKKGKNSEPSSETNKEKNQKLATEQKQLKDDFEKTAEKIEELKKIGDELDKKDDLPGEEESNEVKDEQEKSKESLQQNKPSDAKKSQENALQKMKDMQQQMEGMQNSMEMEMDMQNLEALRQIIHGLIKLSFDQEKLMKNFNGLQQNDPQYNVLAQEQMKLKDDSKVLEDSLLAVSKRDAFMGSIVTKEIGELNNHLDKVIDANRERKRPQASSEMQLSMTSINNLALMLDDHFDMMMQMMANAKPSMKKSKQKGQKPSLSQMQQQLNQKIQELKGSGKSGRQLSEELANSAAEQERIRRALQDMQEKMKNEGKMPGGDLPSKMEQTEMDLVNKQLTDQMIKRQKEILTRLLETEKSMREQDMDDERKGETAKDYEKEIPKAFEEYLRLKEKEVELLKTLPPKLYPYYRKEVDKYFKRIGNQ